MSSRLLPIRALLALEPDGFALENLRAHAAPPAPAPVAAPQGDAAAAPSRGVRFDRGSSRLK